MDDENVPYRSPLTGPTSKNAVDRNEEDFSVLKDVQQTFKQALKALYKDFNAFDVLKEGTTETAKEDMIRQISGKQYAYDILMPLVSTLDSAVQEVEQHRKGQ